MTVNGAFAFGVAETVVATGPALGDGVAQEDELEVWVLFGELVDFFVLVPPDTAAPTSRTAAEFG